jgi:hypothetical protein
MELKTYWWIVDEWGLINFFDNHSDYLYARKHVPGMDYCSTQRCDTFKAVDVESCWVTEELHKWKDGVYEEGKEVN